MTGIHVERHMFTVEEVVGAILPNIGRGREIELRIDGDGYVVVDIVHSSQPPPASSTPDQKTVASENKQESPKHQTAGTPGPKEEEAIRLCGTPLFRAFLEVKTEEAAVKVMTDRCHVQRLSDLDRTRSNGMNLRHVVEEYEAWKIS